MIETLNAVFWLTLIINRRASNASPPRKREYDKKSSNLKSVGANPWATLQIILQVRPIRQIHSQTWHSNSRQSKERMREMTSVGSERSRASGSRLTILSWPTFCRLFGQDAGLAIVDCWLEVAVAGWCRVVSLRRWAQEFAGDRIPHLENKGKMRNYTKD